MRSLKRTVLLFLTLVILVTGASPVLAASPEEINFNPTSERRDDGSLHRLINSTPRPESGQATEIASRFLQKNALNIFGVAATTDKSGAVRFGDALLVDVRTVSSISGTHVWKQAQVNGVPVHQGFVVTHLTHEGAVLFVTNDLGSPRFRLNNPKATVDQRTALDIALNLIGGDGQTRAPQQAELVILRKPDGDHLVWRTQTPTYNPYGDWEIFIDAGNSAVIERSDLLVCIKSQEKPQRITPPVVNERSTVSLDKNALVSGTGSVFIANPLNGRPARYGWREFDPQLPTVTDPVTLTNLDGSGLLVGSWVQVFNSSAARANEPTLTYNYDPTIVAGHFQEANVYFHINEMQEYMQGTLGILNARNRMTDTYAHQGADDNSDYSPAQDRIRFGDGGVDDSDDGEIVLHEYGHAVHNDVVPGFVYAAETGAISEGFGDYFGATYGNNPLVGEWDAVAYNPGPPPFLRRTDTIKHYPEDITNEVHADGEIIAAAWWDFRNLVGAQIADQIIIEAMFYTGINATFQNYADGMVLADQALYAGSHVGYIFQAMGGRGIGATYLLSFNHVPLGDTEILTGPYPVVTTISHTSPITGAGAVALSYRLNTTDPFTSVTMTPTGGFNEWTASIPGPGVNTTVEYYMSVTDDAAISATAPTTAPASVFSFVVGPDTQFPVIAHTPLRDQPLLTWPALVSAAITDNGTIAAATVSYSLNGISQPDLAMSDLGVGEFSATFPEAAAGLTIGDVFQYSITAVDASSSANTTVVGPLSFTIIDALGVVLILDDDTLPKTSPTKYGPDKQPLPPHIRPAASKGAAASHMARDLTTVGWVVVQETAALSDPATWPGYSFIISSSGANTNPVASAPYRAAIEAYVAAGGKMISEGGEVGYLAISAPGYPSYASNVLHCFDWDSDSAGPLTIMGGMASHPILSQPNTVAPTLVVNYAGYGDQDALKVNPEAYIVMNTTDYPMDAGIAVFDDNPNPASAQIVHYGFSYAALADSVEAAKLLQNTAMFLIAPEAAGTASMSGTVQVAGGSAGGVAIATDIGGYSTVTNPDGSWSIAGMFGNTYIVTATLAGFGSAPQTVVLADGQTLTGIDFSLSPIQAFAYCAAPALAIPDADPVGVTSQIMVTDGDLLVDVTVDVDITHTWSGDLIVELTSPAGTTVRLRSQSGGSTANIVTNFDNLTAPDGPGSMTDFDGEVPIGLWTLFISDNAGWDTGTLNTWCLNTTVSNQVVASETPVLEVSQTQTGRELSWDYNPQSGNTFHVYRRLAGENAVRITDQPLFSASGHLDFTDTVGDFTVGAVLFYSLRTVRNGVELSFGDEIEVTVSSTLPTVFALYDNYPNPFNPLTNISFDLPQAGHVSLRVFDLSGRLVRTLVDGNLDRAAHTYQWDGTDNVGRRAASGTYYYRVQTDRKTETGKMMLIK